MACCYYYTFYKSPFVFKSDSKLGQIGVWLPTPLMSQFHIQQVLGFGLDPLPPFGTMSLNPFFLKASNRRYLVTSRLISCSNTLSLEDTLDLLSDLDFTRLATPWCPEWGVVKKRGVLNVNSFADVKVRPDSLTPENIFRIMDTLVYKCRHLQV